MSQNPPNNPVINPSFATDTGSAKINNRARRLGINGNTYVPASDYALTPGTKPGPSARRPRQRAASSSRHASGLMSRMSLMQGKTEHNCKIAAYQTLYTKEAIERGAIIGGAVGEEIRSHVFSTKTCFSVSALNATGDAASFAAFGVTPRGAAGILDNSFGGFDADGSSPGSNESPVTSYSDWATNFDGIRMVACVMEVHNTSRTDSINGEVLMYQKPYEAQGALPSWAVQSSYPHVSSAGATPGDMYRVTWISEEAEDSVFKPTTQVNVVDETEIVFSFRGLPTAGAVATFAVEVYQVWEATVERDNVLLSTTYRNIDHTNYLNHILADFQQYPQWSRARCVVPDGGPLSFLTDLYKDVKNGWANAKKIFGKEKSLLERAMALKDTLEDGISFGTKVAPFLTAREKAARILLTAHPDLRKELCELVNASPADLHEVVNYHYDKRHNKTKKIIETYTPPSSTWDTMSRR